MVISSKQKTLAILIIVNILLLNITNFAVFSGSVQSPDDGDSEESIITHTLLYDSVELFIEGQTTLSLNISFQKDWIYYFSFESYVPFSDVFMMDAFCQTPTSRTYHFFDYTGSIENDVSKIYFEYGSTESGHHIINLMVNTSQNMNIHIYLQEYMPLDLYYTQFSIDIINNNSLYSDINQYSISKNTMEYTYSVKDDVEYKFNFFRVNPISNTDIIENLYENPDVKMTLFLNGTDYDFYRDIPTLDYALYGNVENDLFLDLDRSFYNQTFIERFGAHCTGNLSIFITLEGFIPFDINFAFLLWEVGNIGNGTDGIEQDESDLPNPFNNESDTELHNQSITNTLDKWIAAAGLFIQSNWWALFGGAGTILIIGIVLGKYNFLFKEKILRFKNRHNSDVYDKNKEANEEGKK